MSNRGPQPRPAFITSVPVFGGAEKNLLNLLSEHRKTGLHPAVILVHTGNGVADRFRNAGLPVAEFTLHSWQLRSPWRYAQSFVQLCLPILKHHANIVHINHEYALPYTIRTAKLCRRACVAHIRAVQRPWSRQDILWMARATRVVAVSRAVRASLAESGFPGRIDLIYDGVDTGVFCARADVGSVRESLGVSPQIKLVGMVGRIHPDKGVDILLRAIAFLLQHRTDVQCVIVGSGPAAYAAQMQQLAQELGIGSRTLFAGFRDDVAAIFRSLDVAVVATHSENREEACPNTILEAMASRTPVVASRSGGSVELLGAGRGLLVEPGDPRSLASGISRVLGMGRDQRESMLDRAFRAVCDQFSLKNQAQQILELYSELLKANSSLDPQWRIQRRG